MITETFSQLEFVENPTFVTRNKARGRVQLFVEQVKQNPNQWVVYKNFVGQTQPLNKITIEVYGLRQRFSEVQWQVAVTDEGYQIISKTK